MLSQSLKLWLELIAIFGLVLLIILSSVNNQLNPEIIGVIGVFAAAVFRLLPAAGRITTSIQELKFFKPSLDVIHKELQDENIAHNENLDYEKFKNEIKLININYTYPHSTINVLENINLVIKKGDYIGFIGTSGSGKTTLVDLILGLLPFNTTFAVCDFIL